MIRTKSEIRKGPVRLGPKSETNTNVKIRKDLNCVEIKYSDIRTLNLQFVSCFGFRISNFR